MPRKTKLLYNILNATNSPSTLLLSIFENEFRKYLETVSENTKKKALGVTKPKDFSRSLLFAAIIADRINHLKLMFDVLVEKDYLHLSVANIQHGLNVSLTTYMNVLGKEGDPNEKIQLPIHFKNIKKTRGELIANIQAFHCWEDDFFKNKAINGILVECTNKLKRKSTKVPDVEKTKKSIPAIILADCHPVRARVVTRFVPSYTLASVTQCQMGGFHQQTKLLPTTLTKIIISHFNNEFKNLKPYMQGVLATQALLNVLRNSEKAIGIGGSSVAILFCSEFLLGVNNFEKKMKQAIAAGRLTQEDLNESYEWIVERCGDPDGGNYFKRNFSNFYNAISDMEIKLKAFSCALEESKTDLSVSSSFSPHSVGLFSARNAVTEVKPPLDEDKTTQQVAALLLIDLKGHESSMEEERAAKRSKH